jgi:hypothetical protein
LEIKNGWLVRDGVLQTGRRADIPWWSGSLRGKSLAQAKPALTRFVPGRTGTGFTDDLDEVAQGMRSSNTIGIEQHYGLWYDRRRDDHQRVRRMDGDVWAPFYELPFARSGEGTAWDGLSKYDLTKYNHWYWDRLKRFVDIADRKGLILIHQQYFQHNIIEAGAHYADFPWRSANNINNTGFPEPVNYAGDKRIFMAVPFYDTTHAIRRELHRKYIWQCLDNFKGQGSVIQLIGEEFTGPLHFVQFWLDAIRGWELKYKQPTLTGLSVTKDVQDAILEIPSNPARWISSTSVTGIMKRMVILMHRPGDSRSHRASMRACSSRSGLHSPRCIVRSENTHNDIPARPSCSLQTMRRPTDGPC